MSDGKKETRTRNWVVVLYDDSAPSNWREIIDSWHIEWAESPLHDKDVNGNGEPKKPHRHVMLMFGGVKTYEQVLDLIQPLNCPIPQRVHNVKSMVRYMAHLDNPEKAQYDIHMVIGHGGVDVADLLKPSSGERYEFIKEMQQWCIETACSEFCDLMDYAMTERFDDWFPLLCDSCAFVMQTYLRSRRHSMKPKIDPETGEILDGSGEENED